VAPHRSVDPSLREPQDERERSFRAWPQLADDRLTAAAEEAPQHERDDDDVVELPRDRDEVRHEVERQGEVADERDEQRLLPARDASVPEKAAAEDDTVGDEAGQHPRAFASSGEHQTEHE